MVVSADMVATFLQKKQEGGMQDGGDKNESSKNS